MKTRIALAAELFRFFDSNRIRYAVVGDAREYAKRIRGDLDIVLEPSALEGLGPRLAEFFARRGARLVQSLQHEQTAWYFVFSWENDAGSLQFIPIDICGDYYRGGRLLLTAEEILSDRVQAVGEAGDDLGFYVPAPSMAFIYYLLKRVDKVDLAPEQGAYLSEQWRKDSWGAESHVRRFWREADAALLVRAAESGDWSWVQLQRLLPELRARLQSKVGWRLGWGLGELKRIVRRLRQPTGLWIAFLGPDGSGKSTVLEQVRMDLAPAFRSTRVVHLRPSLGRSGSRGVPVTEPHAEPPRGTFSSFVKMAYWFLDFTAGYLLQTRPAVSRSTLVLYDRYYPDLLADPVRYRYGGSMNLARCLSGLIAHPHLYIILDVPTAEIYRRKNELPMEEIDRQREIYRRLAGELRNAYLVDGSASPDRVARKIEALVIDYMEHRVIRRLLRAKKPPRVNQP